MTPLPIRHVRSDLGAPAGSSSPSAGHAPDMTRTPAGLVVAYVVLMPFLVGLPRGTGVPFIRPSEAWQALLTAAAVATVTVALVRGRRWRIEIRPIEWWFAAMVVTASVLPLLWLAARGEAIGSDELLAAFPFVKYFALYLLVRACAQSRAHVQAIVTATVVIAMVVAAIAMAQALGVGPVIDVLGRFFVSSTEDVVDGGRGTTTIGSSIATGAYLSIACGLAVSRGLAVTRSDERGFDADLRWIGVGAVLALGALASGQAGSVLALAVVLAVVAQLHGRTAQLAAFGAPAAMVGVIAMWPIVAARLATIDQGSGLPSSWVIRWNNISELFLPSLADGGWVLGVSPNAILAPPDVWRAAIYLESGYLWFLWVGGVPLLLAVVGFLVAAWRAMGQTEPNRMAADPVVDAVRIAGRAAVVMIAVLSLIDPHLTLRAGADLFFIVLALGMTGRAIATPAPVAGALWRSLLGADERVERGMPPYAAARLRFSDAGRPSPRPRAGEPDAELLVSVVDGGHTIASTTLSLYRAGPDLRAIVGTVDGLDLAAAGLAWRATVLAAATLRVTDLRGLDGDGGLIVADRGELKRAASLAEYLEIERVTTQHRVNRSTSPAAAERTDRSVAPEPLPPPVRIDVLGTATPGWKRAIDLVLGGLAIVATAPLWLLTALAVRRSSPGPILYRQVRIGTGGLPFQIYKFRTMYADNDDSAHRAQNRDEILNDAEAAKDSADPRITGVGRLLRRTSLDELPQLINVLRGEMSLVGPRPALLWESELFKPESRRRLVARPGLTGLWQISGRADVSMTEMLELDLRYVDEMAPSTDLRCLVKTASSVVAGEGAR